jgi:hypothetical protein
MVEIDGKNRIPVPYHLSIHVYYRPRKPEKDVLGHGIMLCLMNWAMESSNTYMQYKKIWMQTQDNEGFL